MTAMLFLAVSFLAATATAQIPDGDYGGPGKGGVYIKVGAGAESAPEDVSFRVLGGRPYVINTDNTVGYSIGSGVVNVGVKLSTPIFRMATKQIFYLDGGHYRATNAVGNTVYRLDVTGSATTPFIENQPTGATVGPNSLFRLFVNPGGGAPLRYQWFRNNVELPEFTSNVLETRSSAQTVGTYECLISNPQGSVRSAAAIVRFDVAAPTLVLPPTFPLVLGQTSGLGVNVNGGTPPFTYQWFKGGQLLPGQTAFNIAFDPATAASAGTYTVVVSDTYGNSVTSGPCVVSVPLPDPPIVFGDPKQAILVEGGSVSLSARFYSQPVTVPPQVQWRKNGVPIPGGTLFLTDVFNANLQLLNVTAADEGVYDAVAINAGGTSPATKGARVIVKSATSPDAVDLSFNAGTANRIAFNNPNSDGAIEGIAVQPDDKIVVVGTFKQWNGQARTNIVRLNVDGSLDTSFAAHAFTTKVNGEISVPGVAVDSQGRIYVTGNWGTMDGGYPTPLVRLMPSGLVDRSFNPGDVGPGFRLLMLPDGTLLNNGGSLVNGSFRYLLRYPAGGALDSGFGTGFSAARFSGSGPSDWFANPNGSLVLGGFFGASGANGFPVFNLIQLNADGTVAAGFQSPLQQGDGVNSLVRLADGRFVAAGTFQSPTRNLRRFNADGSADTSFDSPVSGASFAPLLLDAQGAVIVPINTGNELVRLQPNGAVDDAFFVHVDDDIKLTALDSKGRIVIAGYFSQVTGAFDDATHKIARKSIARLNGRAGSPVGPTQVALGSVSFTAGGPMNFTLPTVAGVTYILETKAALSDTTWTVVQTITGDGSEKKLQAALAGITGFYRVRTL